MNKSKKDKETGVNTVKQIRKEPKIHLAKYLNIVKLEKWQVAFVKVNYGTKMFTKSEWDRIFKKELSRTIIK